MKRLVVALVVVALATSVVYTAAAPATASRSGGIDVIGELAIAPPGEGSIGRVIKVDPDRQRLYVAYQKIGEGNAPYVAAYDLRSRVPRYIREARAEISVSFAGPYTVELDSKRNRLLFLLSSQATGNEVRVFDADKFKMAATWNLSAVAPGFLPFGLTYSAKDDRVYLLGDFTHSITVSGFPKPIGPGTSILALDAKTGGRAWIRPVPQCQQALTTYGVGALVGRSSVSDALYFGCVTRGLGSGDTFPGQAGLVRLWIDPKADQAGAGSFDVDFFPISGSYYTGASKSGVAFFDRATDRFYMQSISATTPGTWVFDGRASAWVGFVAGINSFNFWGGLNEGNGHYYMGGEGIGGGSKDPKDRPFLLVSDGRSTPVPQGAEATVSVDGFISTDPSTRRLFIPTTQGVKEGSYWRILVAEDHTPDAKPVRPPRYDALTADVEEGPKTEVDYSGGANGYGLRVVNVGGYRAATGFAGQVDLFDQILGGRVRDGDRGLTAARLTSVDLRRAGASATTQSLVADTNTTAELSEQQQTWPWEAATCLDGGGEKISDEKEAQGDRSTVTCDLANEKVEGESSFGAVEAGPVSVGSANFRAETLRDPEAGVISVANAVARGIHIALPSGSLDIAEVEAVGTTVAHGRPGTAKASWVRTVSGIVQRDEAGKVVERYGECRTSDTQDTCGNLFKQINEGLGVKVEFRLPDADIVRTPKGAFAGVQQSNSDYLEGRTVFNQGASFPAEGESRAVPGLQINVYNDSVERSRLVVQLAALQANSIYTVSPVPEIPNFPAPPPADTEVSVSATTGGGDVGAIDVALGEDLAPQGDVAPPADTTTPLAVAPPVARVASGLAFLIRSPAEAFLVGSLWLLFGGAGFTLYRRRMLLGVVE